MEQYRLEDAYLKIHAITLLAVLVLELSTRQLRHYHMQHETNAAVLSLLRKSSGTCSRCTIHVCVCVAIFEQPYKATVRLLKNFHKALHGCNM
jgi:hypothetical protein